MNKVYGTIDDFALVRQDASRVVVSYGFEPVDYDPETEPEEGEVRHATWFEVYFYIKTSGIPDIKAVRQAVEDDIDAQTDAKILNTYPWTILHGDYKKPEEERRIGDTITVWLSRENQDNFKEAHRLATIDASAVIPIRFKLNEDEDKNAIYETFESFGELNGFYLGAFGYIKNDCLDAGWQRKDAIDWQPYEEALEALKPKEEPVEEEQEPSNVEGQPEDVGPENAES